MKISINGVPVNAVFYDQLPQRVRNAINTRNEVPFMILDQQNSQLIEMCMYNLRYEELASGMYVLRARLTGKEHVDYVATVGDPVSYRTAHPSTAA